MPFGKFLSHNAFIKLKDESWLEKLRIAGNCTSNVMKKLDDLIKEKTNLSLIEINDFAESEILKYNCNPTFKNYKGFPTALCISVNNQLVHGVPTDYKLKEGDIISFDFGATYNGAIADTAATFVFGQPKKEEHQRMIKVAEECLQNAIGAIKIGKRIGVIGNAIFKTAKKAGFKVIENYGGHGICATEDGIGIPHDQPFISNKAEPTDGVRITNGLLIAIEPLLVPGNCSTKTRTGNDGWTVYTEDVSVHTEKTIFVYNDKVEIITERI